MILGLNGPDGKGRRSLDAFYEEAFDAGTALESTENREGVHGPKIHARHARAAAEAPNSSFDPSEVVNLQRTLET